MRISDWSSDVCSSDLLYTGAFANRFVAAANGIGLPLTSQGLRETLPRVTAPLTLPYGDSVAYFPPGGGGVPTAQLWHALTVVEDYAGASAAGRAHRSEEHTSELQSLMRISYAVFCLKKQKHNRSRTEHTTTPAITTP